MAGVGEEEKLVGKLFRPVYRMFVLRKASESGPGGGTPILKLYGDVPPFRVWIFDRPLINMVSNSKIFEDFLY